MLVKVLIVGQHGLVDFLNPVGRFANQGAVGSSKKKARRLSLAF
jgi:hypothetical protein